MELILTHWQRLWLCNKFLCSIFSKSTQSFNFIKGNIIRKLAYKAKYVSQIKGGFMFGRNWRLGFFKLVDSIVDNMEKIDTGKWKTINIVQCSKC